MFRKKLQLLWLLALVISYFLDGVQNIELNMTAYFKMPKLYDFDDYDSCLQDPSIDPSTYCFVRAEVLPENSSAVWRTIEHVSKYRKHHFDHRHLYFGLCVPWCERTLQYLDTNKREALYGGVLSSNKKVNTYLNLFSSEDSNRQRYHHRLNLCINLRLRERHDLKAESVIEYCDINNKLIVHDTWNMCFYITVCLLIVLATCSSFYDLYLKHQEKLYMTEREHLKHQEKFKLTDREHYITPVNGIGNKVCVMFSITRNWYRLRQESTGKIGRDLRFLDCYKFFCMFLVMFDHTNLIIYEGAITNPQDPERMLHTMAGTILISGSVITVTFFVIGGFLLGINWIAVVKKKGDFSFSDYIKYFVKFNGFRYIRLTVPYAFVLLMSGVYFANPGGPLWRHIIEREQLACRKNWWTNLLYINSFVNTDERCLLQSWYLAADTHLFVLNLIVLMVATNWPKMRKYLFSVIITLCFLIPGLFVYLKNEEALYIDTLQTQKDCYVGDRQFAEFYTPFYMNFGPYFFGVLTALAYNEISLGHYKRQMRKAFQVLWYALIPTAILWLLSAHPMIQYYQQKPSIIWSSLYASMQRNIWGFGLSIFIIGMSAKVGWIFRKFSCLPIFRILGRLTYGAFIVHLLLGRIVLGTSRQPLYFGPGMMLANTLFSLTASYLFSLVMAIFVELPVSSFLKLLR